MKIATAFLSAFVSIVAAFPVYSQEDKWSFEIRTDAAFATQDLGDAELDTGIALDGVIAYNLSDTVSAYAGWGWSRFATGQSFAGANVDFEVTGYTFGLRYISLLGDTGLDYLVRAGGIYNHIEVENSNGDIVADSGHSLGWEVGAELMIPISDSWSLTPGIRYQALSTDIQIAATNTSVDLEYFAVGVGLTRPF